MMIELFILSLSPQNNVIGKVAKNENATMSVLVQDLLLKERAFPRIPPGVVWPKSRSPFFSLIRSFTLFENHLTSLIYEQSERSELYFCHKNHTISKKRQLKKN